MRATQRQRSPRGEGERLRAEIIKATEALLLERGTAEAISVRDIAKAVGVTPPAIYMHFAGKDDLVNTVVEDHFRLFESVLAEAIEASDGPIDTLRAMGRAYVRFGLSHPEEYRVLFMDPARAQAPAEVMERFLALSGFDALVNVMADGVEAGDFKQKDAFELAAMVWVGVHGLTSLQIAKPNFPWPADFIDHAIETMVDAVIVTPAS